MSGASVEVLNLGKTFQVRRPLAPGSGRRQRLGHWLKPTYAPVAAVRDLTFSLSPGERVAFVGPNGAGKSTTIKMLTGILSPSAGQVSVLGLTPCQDRMRLGFRVGAVFGQRSQLWLHLPASDSFDLLARVYDLDLSVYQKRRQDLVERFQLGPLLLKPVRQLSLGERMRCELVASLLHQPDVLFLDEPTIGLDVVAKAEVRRLVRERAEQDGATVLLTSHDTGDMEQVCDRILVINDGRLVLDSRVADLRRTYLRHKIVTLRTVAEHIGIDLPGVRVLETSPHLTRLAMDPGQASLDALIHGVLKTTALTDVTIEDPPLDDVIRKIYAEGRSPDEVRT